MRRRRNKLQFVSGQTEQLKTTRKNVRQNMLKAVYGVRQEANGEHHQLPLQSQQRVPKQLAKANEPHNRDMVANLYQQTQPTADYNTERTIQLQSGKS